MKQATMRLLVLVFAVFALGRAFAAEGDDWPRRPIKLIVPNAAGSSNDTLSRILAQQLGQELGQNIVVENDAGAAGLVGMEMGKNSAPDGYTLIAGSPSATTIAANLRKKLPYDPLN
ncbi:MAG TPA: tripartite tricarboxylate transporter substrate-binding protein, partial [Usitatibacter sp.]|nr:tripartite tricarboxylate transporter substrate-binding protein [Usitatibacter sp.]